MTSQCVNTLSYYMCLYTDCKKEAEHISTLKGSSKSPSQQLCSAHSLRLAPRVRREKLLTRVKSSFVTFFSTFLKIVYKRGIKQNRVKQTTFELQVVDDRFDRKSVQNYMVSHLCELNIFLFRLLLKTNKSKNMLQHMASQRFHYTLTTDR